MQHIQGIFPKQLQVSSIEDAIAADNSIRFMDAFVGCNELKNMDLHLTIGGVQVLPASLLRGSLLDRWIVPLFS